MSLVCHFFFEFVFITYTVSSTIHSTSVAMVTIQRTRPSLPFSHGNHGNVTTVCPFAHAQCAVPLDPISYFNEPNKRERDIRKMATALVVSAPQRIPKFTTTRFSAVWKENGTDLWQRYVFNVIDGLWRNFLSHAATSPMVGSLRRPQQHQVSITTLTMTSVAF